MYIYIYMYIKIFIYAYIYIYIYIYIMHIMRLSHHVLVKLVLCVFIHTYNSENLLL